MTDVVTQSPPNIPRDYEILIRGAVGALDNRIDGLQALVNERHHHNLLTLAEMDRRYTERWQNDQTALATALNEAEKAVTAALVAAEKAVNKAEVAQDKRNDAANEFRGQLKDQNDTMIPRLEAAATFAQYRQLIDDARNDISTMRGDMISLAGRQKFEDQSTQDQTSRAGVWVNATIGILTLVLTVITIIVLIAIRTH